MVPARRRFVVCGPPDCGKTTWVRSRAEIFDLIWDFDAVANAMVMSERDLRHVLLPGYVPVLMGELQATLLRFVERGPFPSEVGVFVIVTNRLQAERLCGVINADLIDLGA